MRRLVHLAAVVIAVVALTACSTKSVTALDVGECITELPDSFEVSELDTIDCAEPHGAEVYHEEELTGDAYPEDIDAQVDEICLAAFEEWVGLPYNESAYLVTSLYPQEAGWDDGDKEVTCLILPPQGEETMTDTTEGINA